MGLSPRRHDLEGVEIVIKDADGLRLIVGERVHSKVAAPLHGHALNAIRAQAMRLLADEG